MPRITATAGRAGLALLLGLLAGAASQEGEAPDVEKLLGRQRDALIAKIARGEELAASTRSFEQLLLRREKLLAAAREAAAQAERDEVARKEAAQAAAAAQLRAEEEQRRREALLAEAAQRIEAGRQAYLSSLDHYASKYCYLSADPRQRHFAGGVTADWGRVVKKSQVRIPAENALADEQSFPMFEIAGVREHSFVRGEVGKKELFAVGELVFLCGGAGDADRKLPPPWNEVPLTSSGYSGRLSRPPRIADKGKWNPIHTKLTDLFWAIREVKWKYPPERYVLANLKVGKDLGSGRFEIPADDETVTFVLEVPPAIPQAQKELVKPAEWIWVIMGNARFDRQLKKLVLTAADIEARYILEKP